MPGWTQTCGTAEGSADKVWSGEQETTPPATHHHHSCARGARKSGIKERCFLRSFLLSGAGLWQVGPRGIRSTLLVGVRPEHLTQPVHTAPQAPLLSQAGLAAPGSVGKGTACPLGGQNSIQKAPPQMGVVLGAGVESDTTTLAVSWGN